MEPAVLVTGGAGFVGSYVVRDLLARGERVLVYDRFVHGNALDLVIDDGRDAQLIRAEGPITDGWRIYRLCRQERVDRIVHLAAPLTQDVATNPITGVRDVCEGTATVFEVATSISAKRVVWASSVAVFGAKKHYQPGPLANDACHRPANLYGGCKSLCELMAAEYRASRGLDTIALRLSVVYGAGRLRGYMSFPSELIRLAGMGQPVTIPIAEQQINWQYVEEASAMMLAALDAPQTTDVAFNTCGDARTFRDAGEILMRVTGNSAIAFSEAATDDGQVTLSEVPSEYDATEFCEQIGYSPQFPLERGIEESLAAYGRLPELELNPAS